MYKHILVAVDGSDNSLRAMEDAIKAASTESQIEILYVSPTGHLASEILKAGTLDAFNEQNRQKFAREEAAVKASGISYKVTIEYGEAEKIIANYANDNDVDLVVIGRRGLTAMQEVVFGRVSTYVMKHVNCSCLLVK